MSEKVVLQGRRSHSKGFDYVKQELVVPRCPLVGEHIHYNGIDYEITSVVHNVDDGCIEVFGESEHLSRCTPTK